MPTSPEAQKPETQKPFQPSWIMEKEDEFSGMNPSLQLRVRQIHQAPESIARRDYLEKHYLALEEQVVEGKIPEDEAGIVLAKIVARIEELESQQGALAESLRRSQQRQAKAQQGRTQKRSSGVQQGQQPNSPPPSVVASSIDAEKEVFGEGEAFSDRWVGEKGIPKTVQYYRSRFGTEEEDDDIDLNNVGSSPGTFKPSELFTTILETGGRDPRSGRMLSYLLEAYPGDSKSKEKFSSALVNGFLAMASLKDGLNSGRIDTLAEALRRGPSPQGIAQWLLFDPETSRSLALILALQGYQVAGVTQEEVKKILGLNEKGILPTVKAAFSDHENIRPDEIKKYLEKVRKAVGTDGPDGTDPGVVKLAYYIFRVLGHPHENYKFSQELTKKYMFVKGAKDEKYPNRDLAPEDIASFLLKFDDPTKAWKYEKNKKTDVYYDLSVESNENKDKVTDDKNKDKVFLKDVLEKEGVIGLARSLNRLPAEKIVREWSDMQLILDMMDQISDIRAGRGAGSSLLPSERLRAIRSVKELGTALAKRKLSQETVDRLVDTSKIVSAPGSTEVSFWEKTLYGMKVPISGIGKRKPKVKDD